MKNDRFLDSSKATVLTIACAAMLVACASTRQTRSVEPQGFLRDYSQIRKGQSGEAQLVYIDEGAAWDSYDSILIDSVTIWYSKKTQDLSAEDRQALTDLFYQALYDQLSQDYHIAERPGPGTLRLRAAITQAKGASVVGNTVTTVVPQARLLSTLVGTATDAQVFVGAAAIEGEITDSLSGRRLAAIVDERAGGKSLSGLGGKWKDVDNAFQYWAERLRTRLAELRGR
jgi:hypothetical protein